MKIHVFIGLSFLLILQLSGQQTNVYHVHKTETFTWSSNKVEQIEVNTERADWSIKTWTKPEIKIEAVQWSQHPSKIQAEKDLSLLNVVSKQSGKSLFVKSSVLIPRSGVKPLSTMGFKFEITVPENTLLILNNKLGRIQFHDANMKVKLVLELCQMEVSNSRLVGSVSQKFGESILQESDLEADIKLFRATANWTRVRGRLNLESQNSRVFVEPDSRLNSLNIHATASEVRVVAKGLEHFFITIGGKNNTYDFTGPTGLKMSENNTYLGGDIKSDRVLKIMNNNGSVQISNKR